MTKIFEDFSSFKDSNNALLPSDSLNDKIKATILSKMKITFFGLEKKVLISYLFFCALTLVFCPQMGMNSIFMNDLIGAYFLKASHTVCALFCGAAFMGLPSFFVSFMLDDLEFAYFNKKQFLYISLHSLVGVLILKYLNSSSYHYDLQFIALWCFGALVSSQLFVHFAQFLRNTELKPV